MSGATEFRHKGTKDAVTIFILCEFSLCPLCLYEFPLLQSRHIVGERAADHCGPPPGKDLLADTKLLNQGPVFSDVFLL